ncbi:MAG: hypothetical protein RMM17_11490 [Acidobacteriota bacterium]|nr:hypothetical protein [Blastocatellia bacterium]MDW8413295.1 hypothetical protein [Acidobacteriota bacterium]
MYEPQIIEQTQIALIEALAKATDEGRLNWIRTDPEQVKWKEGTVEQLYTMISDEGIFATFARMRDNSMELLIQVQETGCYREYELNNANGAKVTEALRKLYYCLPSVSRMVEDFQDIVRRLDSSNPEPVEKDYSQQGQG